MLRSEAPPFFGIRDRKVSFKLFFEYTTLMKRLQSGYTSTLTTTQQWLKKAIVKPSRSRALSPHNAWTTSSSVNCLSSQMASQLSKSLRKCLPLRCQNFCFCMKSLIQIYNTLLDCILSNLVALHICYICNKSTAMMRIRKPGEKLVFLPSFSHKALDSFFTKRSPPIHCFFQGCLHLHHFFSIFLRQISTVPFLLHQPKII